MKLEIFGISDKGCVRDHNEDMVLIGNEIFRDDIKQTVVNLKEKNAKFFAAVADGMGGHNAGEVASEIVLQRMRENVNTLKENLAEKELSEKVSEWVKTIHSEILNEGNKDIEKHGMGSTLIGALFYNGISYFMNVGDSRLYRFRSGIIKQMSRDHSMREATGNEDVASNLIYNSFGGGEKIFVDFEQIGGKLIDNDVLLLCSDGLSDMLTDDEIENILSKEDALKDLMNEAKDKGGEDNISIVLIKINLNDIADTKKQEKKAD